MLLRMALRKKMAGLTAVITAVALAIVPVPALAQQQKGPPVIRDTESEQLLREYTRPILRTAGLEKQNIQIVIINESVFNAFVADGRRIFVNYGAMMQSESPNQIIGVLAHETGHLAGGHLAKPRRACTKPSSGLPMTACSPRAVPIPSSSRIRCLHSASRHWRNSPVQVP